MDEFNNFTTNFLQQNQLAQLTAQFATLGVQNMAQFLQLNEDELVGAIPNGQDASDCS